MPPFPRLRQIYIPGFTPGWYGAFHEVTLTDTLVAEGDQTHREANPPLLYDASGVTDPDVADRHHPWPGAAAWRVDQRDARTEACPASATPTAVDA
jgi:phosphomethylpyrimidine synthase